MKNSIMPPMGPETGYSPFYSRMAKAAAVACGRSGTFALACSIIGAWLLIGPIFGFSDTWQLIINTATTIVTFLMMFLLQNTHNRDMEITQKKLDVLLTELSNLDKKG